MSYIIQITLGHCKVPHDIFHLTSKHYYLNIGFFSVQTVSQNSKALEKLQKINPSPCREVQNTATRLRNGIAQLRSKIDKAKTITSAIPVSLQWISQFTKYSGKSIVDKSIYIVIFCVSVTK